MDGISENQKPVTLFPATIIVIANMIGTGGHHFGSAGGLTPHSLSSSHAVGLRRCRSILWSALLRRTRCHDAPGREANTPIEDAIAQRDIEEVKALTQKALDRKISPNDILNEGKHANVPFVHISGIELPCTLTLVLIK
jgi:hypothetical protein